MRTPDWLRRGQGAFPRRLALSNQPMTGDVIVSLVTNFVNLYTEQRGIAQGKLGFSG